MTGLENILDGGSITEFIGDELPTVRNVLRFYSQFWRIRKSDSMKETLVSNALQEFYQSRGAQMVCIGNIRKKIRSEVGKLRSILKFSSKKKTPRQIKIENDYKVSLSRVFPVESNGIENLMETDDDLDNEENGSKFLK